MEQLSGVEPKADFAEQLSRWMGVFDAIALHAALGQAAPSAGPAADLSAEKDAIEAEVARVRRTLEKMIAAACSAEGGMPRIRFPSPSAVMTADPAIVSYLPCMAFHRAVQREFEHRVGQLRVSVRKALVLASPALCQLAALDEAMEKTLGPREAELIAEIPALLEQRFMHLYNRHRQSLAGLGSDDDPQAWSASGHWLARFRDEIHEILQAELDLRLQPAIGLAEALVNEVESIK